jgi:hypothetical protein
MMVAAQLAASATWDAVRIDPGTPEFVLASAIAASITSDLIWFMFILLYW